MAPDGQNSIGRDPTIRGQANMDQLDRNPTSVNAQDQTLLKALQDLIARVVDPMQTNNTNQITLGPEAGKLITALQEFISSILIRSQLRAQNTIIDVSWDEEDSEHQENEQYNESTSKSDGNVIRTNNSGNSVALEKPQPPFEENLLKALREQVFSKMPIRLLCFEPYGPSFRISLLERSAVFSRLASELRGKMHEEEFHSQRRVFRRIGGVESVTEETEAEIIRRLISKYVQYAILSHTWLRTASGEVTYSDWNKGFFNSEDSGYRKLVNFCKVAWKDHDLIFGWMDTICINKESSSELDESIRSMYNWYERASVCITYLAETETLANMHLDPWFTRGWTLQELLAPSVVKFYDGHWKQFVDHSDNDKVNGEVTQQIERATAISLLELKDIREAPISRRMQLAATREVTREEDTAYSLMGIFDVSISTAYGEGAQRAFLRLLQEIMASSKNTLDILNWAGNIPFSHLDTTSAILPTSPKCYTNRSSGRLRGLNLTRPIEPLALSHLGLRLPVVLMPGISIRGGASRCHPIGDYNATVNISPVGYYHTVEDIPTTYNLLDSRVSGSDGWKYNEHRQQMTFAVFNFTGAGNTIFLEKMCIALGLDCSEPAGEISNAGEFEIIRTDEPIVFNLSKRNANPEDLGVLCWSIKTDELGKHGMQLISLYL